MKKFLFILALLICSFGCEITTQTQVKMFSLTMEKRLSVGPCSNYNLSLDVNGNASAVRNCMRQLEPSKCDNYASNGISTEKIPCFKDETEKLEKKLNNEELERLREAIIKSNFFSFEDDFSGSSKKCTTVTTDLSNTILTIKSDEKEKAITHYQGCFVKQNFSESNALQPLTDLENKIDEIVGTKQWIRGN
jgi:hypothetical protein